MTTMRVPYFIKNKKWCYYDEKELKYKLTKNTSKKGIDSYKSFYEIHDIIKKENDFYYKLVNKIKKIIKEKIFQII